MTRWLSAALLALCLPNAAWPAEPAPTCSAMAGISALAPDELPGPTGQWAEYAVIQGGKPNLTQTFRVLLVGAPWKDKPAKWMELWMDKVGEIATRSTKVDGRQVTLFRQGAAIYEVPSNDQGAPSPCRPDPTQKVIEEEITLRTLAGPITCRHVRKKSSAGDIDVWYTPQVPPMNMVRVYLPGGRGYELVARGTGGVSSFPEKFTPAPFPKGEAIRQLVPQDLLQKAKEINKQAEEQKAALSGKPSPSQPSQSSPAAPVKP